MTEQPQPERLSPDDLATHQAALAQMQAAQAVWRWWSAVLAQRYKVGPQDRIIEDGAIVRTERVTVQSIPL